VSGQALAATLPLPAIGAPFADVQQIKERLTEQVALQRSRGKHAAPRPAGLSGLYGSLRKSRFLVFSAIGGFVFVLGLAVQVWLTGTLHVRPEVSYLAQAVVSVEVSFVLNRWLTWRDRDTRLLRAFAFFNLQKTLTIAINAALYVGLLRLGMNYLLDNVVLTAAFTVINYVAGDKLVFVPVRKWRDSAASPADLATDVGSSSRAFAAAEPQSALPVSVVIPVRDNERTIGATVRSLLAQDYPHLGEIVIVGSPGDRTWEGLSGITDRRLVTVELETPPGVRDANFKRDAGIRSTAGDLVALVDSDIVLPPDWMSTAVAELEMTGASCVAGGMKSAHNTFWGRYTDSTRLGAKTPRIGTSYSVTKEDFGKGSNKPPITANTLFHKDMYLACPINATWSHGSYEDYEWFWRVVSAGYSVTVSRDLFGWHEHRRGIRPLVKEYLRSSRGCAYFIWAHGDSPLARRRLIQAIALPTAGIVATIVAAGAVTVGEGKQLAAAVAAGMVVLAIDQFARSRRLESLAYPATGFMLGLVFTTGLLTNLIKSSPVSAGKPAQDNATLAAGRDGVILTARPDELSLTPRSEGLPQLAPELVSDIYRSSAVVASGRHARPLAAPVPAYPSVSVITPRDFISILDLPAPREAPGPSGEPGPEEKHRSGSRLRYPLIALCALQAVVSLTLVWSNTAFTDEATNLWIGRLLLANWQHGAPWPTSYGQRTLPGSPFIYPPIGALADRLGGLTGARIVALALMLGATILLYFTAERLIGRTPAIFATILWVFTEPVIRLTFATSDPLAVLLVALSAWLIVEAGYRRRHGELVAASAAALALANVASYSSTLIDPALLGFALCFWRSRLQPRQAASSTAWLAGGLFVFLGGLLTISRSWPGFASMAFGRGIGNHQDIVLILTDIWSYSGLIIILGLISAIVAMASQGTGRAPLIAVLGSAALIVPAAQLISQTAAMMDRRLAYGMWFAAIAGGFGCAKLIQRLPGSGRPLIGAVVGVVIAYLGFTSWQSASDVFHGWPNSKSFVASFAPVAAKSNGLIFVAGQEHVAEYSTTQGADWVRWNTGALLLRPPGKATVAYYLQRLRSTNYGLIALFYPTSFTTSHLPTDIFTAADPDRTAQEVLDSLGGATQPGLGPLTAALREDHAYRLVTSGPYDAANSHGTYAIWQKVSEK
jgi:putative flippase GtrA